MRVRLDLLYVVAFLSFSQGARASGFSILELGGRGAGMGGAFTAIADDGSALFYNPAGIGFQKGLRIEMDGFLVKGNYHFFPSATPPGTIVPKAGYSGTVSPTVQILANMYMSKDLPRTKWTLGFGLYAPFGLGDNWTDFKDSQPANEKFVGRFAGTRGLLQNIWAQPTVAFRPTENMSIAVGPAVVYTHLLLEESILNPRVDGVVFGTQLASLILPGQDPTLAGQSIGRLLPEGRARFAGTAFAPGATAGWLYKHRKSKTNFGASWRSAVTYHVSGKASFAFTSPFPLQSFFTALNAPSFTSLFPNQDIKASFTTPNTINLGIANSAFKETTFSFDFVFQNYRRFKQIPLNFSKTQGTATPPELDFAFNFHDTYFVRAGVERHLTKNTIVRGGYYYDHAAAPDPTVGPFFPDNSKNVLCLGASRQLGNKEVTFFYQGAFQQDRVVNIAANNNQFTNGTYKVFIHLIGFAFRLNKGGTTIDTNP